MGDDILYFKRLNKNMTKNLRLSKFFGETQKLDSYLNFSLEDEVPFKNVLIDFLTSIVCSLIAH